MLLQAMIRQPGQIFPDGSDELASGLRPEVADDFRIAVRGRDDQEPRIGMVAFVYLSGNEFRK